MDLAKGEAHKLSKKQNKKKKQGRDQYFSRYGPAKLAQ